MVTQGDFNWCDHNDQLALKSNAFNVIMQNNSHYAAEGHNKLLQVKQSTMNVIPHKDLLVQISVLLSLTYSELIC